MANKAMRLIYPLWSIINLFYDTNAVRFAVRDIYCPVFAHEDAVGTRQGLTPASVARRSGDNPSLQVDPPYGVALGIRQVQISARRPCHALRPGQLRLFGGPSIAAVSRDSGPADV